MATSETLLFKIEGVKQAAQVADISGQTFTVGKISTAGNTGLAKWMFLEPTATGAKGSIALKIEGTRQIAQLSGLSGKTVAVGASPATLGGTGKWLLLNTGKGAAAATGAGVGAGLKGKTAAQMVLVKAEGGRQAVDTATLAGKTFTVMKPPMMEGVKTANWMFLKPATGAGVAGEKIVVLEVQGGVGTTSVKSLIGKSYTVSKAPLAAGAAGPQWLAFKPATSIAGKGAIAATAAAKGKAGVTTKGAAVAKAQTGKAAASLAGNPSSALQTAKAVGSGTIWNGKGMSLGLGIGLGAWGPIIALGVAVTSIAAYGYYKNNKDDEYDSIDETVNSSSRMAELLKDM
ncbi:MAG: hypothetical protein HQL69_22695 [Magnetococcales bacterium]|nr:hypothetical protein [Magnetococcales bacterium]